MTYAFVQDVPANEEMYAQIKTIIGDTPPAGLIAHIAVRHGNGLRYVDVWDSEDSWTAFRDGRVEPAVAEVMARYGIVADHSKVHIEQADVVDVWLGAVDAAVR
jgi:hypothetical protein